ncbi:helix-turn-helix domain-containing protein [Patescibacteria group bacterium]|nr:helix-turn-helix domain-containing protein [Patescibacteria group bacterium]
MISKSKKIKLTDFDDILREDLKNPEYKKLFDYYGKQLEISLSLIRLRKKMGMTQSEVAKKIGTTQSNIARMETGQQNFTVEMLDKLAKAFGKELKVVFN